MDGAFHSESFVSEFLKRIFLFFYAFQLDLRITKSILRAEWK